MAVVKKHDAITVGQDIQDLCGPAASKPSCISNLAFMSLSPHYLAGRCSKQDDVCQVCAKISSLSILCKMNNTFGNLSRLVNPDH